MALYFLSLLVVKLCHAISCTNQMIFSCTWKRTSLPNHVHLWGVTAEQRAVIYSSEGSVQWAQQTPQGSHFSRDTQVTPVCKRGSKMQGLKSRRPSVEGEGAGSASAVTTRAFDRVQHPVAGMRTELSTDTAAFKNTKC